MLALSSTKARYSASPVWWARGVPRRWERCSALTRSTAEISMSMGKRLRSRVRRMRLNVVSDTFQRTERDLVLLCRRQLPKIQQWRIWTSSPTDHSLIRRKRKRSRRNMWTHSRQRRRALISSLSTCPVVISRKSLSQNGLQETVTSSFSMSRQEVST